MKRYSRTHLITAWGERRSVTEWAEDSRCVVGYITILQRVERGFTPEDAIATPSLQRYELTAFGETKAVADWAEDARCAVMLRTLHKRLRQGWEGEKALSTPRQGGLVLTAWGETKALAVWARDPRAIGGPKTLLWRFHQGWEPEDIVAGRKGGLGKSKLDGKEQEIMQLLQKKVSKASIARIVEVSRITLNRFIRTRKLQPAKPTASPPLTPVS